MRGYVETMERIAYFMPEGREPTDLEVCTAMADQLAEIDDLVNANIRQMAGPNPVRQEDGS